MLTRRTFLKTAGAVSAVPLLQASFARAAANERLTLGVIGVGTMGRYHLGSFLGRDDVEVIGVCDVVQERIENAVTQVQKAYSERTKSGSATEVKAYTDLREMLSNSGLDAVVIATPDHWHAIACLLAARQGKHIYCEKPLTHTISEGRRIVEEVRQAKIVFQTGSQQRSEFGGYFRRAVEYVHNGRIGTLKTIRIGVGGPPKPCDLPAQEVPPGTDWNTWLGPAPERAYSDVLCPNGVHSHFPQWRSYQEFAGGGLADMGAHHFDIAQWALGMDASGPVEVHPPESADQEYGLRFVYANGVVMIHNEFEGDVKADCVFEGTDGMILVSRSGISSRPESILAEALSDDAVRIKPSSNHHQDWLDAIRGGAEPIATAETGHRSATICHLANIGYRLRRPLRWDPMYERFVGDAGADVQLSRQPRGEWQRV